MNNKYKNQEFKSTLKQKWNVGEPAIFEDKSKFITDPFKCTILHEFWKSEDFLGECISELKTLPVKHQNNDLYKFEATPDLLSVELPNIAKMYSIFEGPIRKWVSNITGIILNKKVALSCSKYKYSDRLLCHNDELEGRRIAFILYLVSPWKEEYGGSLDLFSVDDQLRPNIIKEQIYPSFNTFAFFEVSPTSYHQVCEVFGDVTRLSINGWFHGEPIEYPPPRIINPPVYLLPGTVEEQEVYAWISPLYLDESTQVDIKKEFSSKSEISLSDFLKTKKFIELKEAFNSIDSWKWTGPPDQKHYQVLHRKICPQIIKDFLALMHSEALFLVLSQLTGLQLHHMAPDESDDEPSEEDEPEDCSDDESINNEGDNDPNEPSCSNQKEEDDNNLNEPSCSNQNKKRKCFNENRTNKRKKIENRMENNLTQHWETDIERKYLRKMRRKMEQGELVKAEATSQVIQWTPGCYSLMRDDDFQSSCDFTLDARFFVNVPENWDTEMGGAKVYAAKGETDELLSVHPSSNCLALVYRDKDTCAFTNYINCKAMKSKKKFKINEIHFQYKKIDSIKT